jgi:Rod binding domain-containing protein
MTTKIGPLGGPTAPERTKANAKPDPALARVAEEFESALLRQILKAAKVGGKDADKGYGSIAVDALANGLVAGGGIGLARAIEEALARAETPKSK